MGRGRQAAHKGEWWGEREFVSAPAGVALFLQLFELVRCLESLGRHTALVSSTNRNLFCRAVCIRCSLLPPPPPPPPPMVGLWTKTRTTAVSKYRKPFA